MTENQIHWARYRNRANAARRKVYFLKNQAKIQERQRLREERLALEQMQKARLAKRLPTHPAVGRKPERSAARIFVIEAKRGKPCQDCGGFFHPEAMDFDHRDPALKTANLSVIVKSGTSAVAREIAKCDLVCANCHRVRTSRCRQGLPATLPPPEYEI